MLQVAPLCLCLCVCVCVRNQVGANLGAVVWSDLEQKLLFRLWPDGLKESTALVAGDDGFAKGVFADGTQSRTLVPNLMLEISVCKRPACFKKPACCQKPAAAADSPHEKAAADWSEGEEEEKDEEGDEKEEEGEDDDAEDWVEEVDEEQEPAAEAGRDKEDQAQVHVMEDAKEAPHALPAGGLCVDGVFLPPGWWVETRVRGGADRMVGQSYKMYHSPIGKLFRSLKEARMAWSEIE